ncbi:MAG TPA: mannose-6-phosphate isomerase, class I, partial [Flavisolibacter sp.]|nr:mannose-6-phosphate isomerase, class I [Flavisolibacter sp.]
MQTIYPIAGRVQHYSWGGYQFIPSLLQIPNEDKQPYAEYWLGAHPAFPSTLLGKQLSLATLIQTEGEQVLGRACKKFTSLPFLFKVLDVRQMLSIQVHPSKEEAVKGYRAEEAAGIPVGAPHRNYKDENHKPEAMVAISDFWLLHGFKPTETLLALLASVPELSFLSDVLQTGGYEALYALVMNLPQSKINVLLHPLADRILPLYDGDQLERDSEHFWAARAIRTFCQDGNLDRGIFSIYLFNLVHLRPGEGIY